MDNIAEYIRQQTRIEREEERPYSIPQINGFTPLVNFGFDAGIHSNGGRYSFATYREQGYLIDYAGFVFDTDLRLSNETLINDMIVYRSDYLYGVKNMFGQIIAEPEFERIEILGNTILATCILGFSDLFVDSDRVHRQLSRGITLLSENELLIDGFVHDLDLNLLKANNVYSVVGKLTNGKFIITCGQLLGFSDQFLNVTIPPIHFAVMPFNKEGFASVRTVDGIYKIIDRNGQVVVIEENGLIPINFDGEKIVFQDSLHGNRMGIADKNFIPLSSQRFINIYQNRVFHNRFIIERQRVGVEDRVRFFDIDLQVYLVGVYETISIHDNHFIARCDNGRFTLYDSSLNFLILDADGIYFCGKVLMVNNWGRVYFYRVTD